MKTKDKIIAFAVLIAAIINTYECAKKIKRDVNNWAETTTITKNINVENTKDNNHINIPTRRIDCELISMKEMRERLGIPEEIKVQEIEQDTNKEEITQEVNEADSIQKAVLLIGREKISQNSKIEKLPLKIAHLSSPQIQIKKFLLI